MKMQKLIALLLAMVLALTLAAPALAEDGGEDIIILYTNDIHSYIDKDLTYSMIAAYKKSLTNVLLVDAGDEIQGDVFGAMDKGNSIIGIMNAAGYDLATPGNHDFDYGMEGFQNAVEWAAFPYVSCNFHHEKDGVAGDPVLDAYKVFTVGGKKIAFVGITTPETITGSTPKYFQDGSGNYIYGIAAGTDGAALYAAVQKAIDAASAEADLVIGLGHLGVNLSSSPWMSEEVIAHTTGLDAFIDGHSHTTMPEKEVTDAAGDPVLLTQTGCYLGAVGQLTIAADGSLSSRLLTADDLADITPDPDVLELEQAWEKKVNDQLGKVIGSIDDTLDNFDADGNRLVRKQETNAGDFAADAYYYVFDNMDLAVDCAIINGGGVRNQAITGELTYETCKVMNPFGNMLCLQTVTGQQLLDALEWGARNVGEGENGGFLQVSHLKYEIHADIPSTVQADEKDVWTGGPTGEYRVQNVQILDRDTGKYVPLDLDAQYNVEGISYTLHDMGDGCNMFNGSVTVLDGAMEDYMALAEYIQSFPGGKVTGYAEPQGRITILGAGENTGDTEGAAESAGNSEAADAQTPAASHPATYTVVKGDCLWNIALHEYGDGMRWNDIYQMNRDIIFNPNEIEIGQVLKMPAA